MEAALARNSSTRAKEESMSEMKVSEVAQGIEVTRW